MTPRIAVLLCAILSARAAPSGPRPYLAIIEKVAGAVGFYTEDGRLLAQVKIGSFPHEAVLSKDGRLYVTENGVLWSTEDRMGSNTISVLDVRSMKKVDQISLGRLYRPHGIAFVPGTSRLLVSTERPTGLAMVDTVRRKVIRSYEVKGKTPQVVIPLPGGQWAFVTNADSNAVAAIELRTGNVKLIPVGGHPQGAVLSPDGGRVYIVNTNGNRILIIDVRRQQVVGMIPTGKGPGRIAITPDGKTLVYNLQLERAVGFADVERGEQTDVVPLSGRPLSLTITRDGYRAFAGIQNQDRVCFISVPTRKIERVLTLPKGSGPDPAIPLEEP